MDSDSTQVVLLREQNAELVAKLSQLVTVLDKVSEDDDGVMYFNGRYCGELQQPLAEARAILSKVKGQ